jgi:hypothetical protein
MHDCFVTCWNEKFKTNRLRPETAIRLLIDSHWTPLLQTPPFPEYTSGHSIVSTYAGKILTYFFGPTSSFTDNTETNFGMPTRSFKNIETAAQEACISRLYGGIHFRDAIENGQIQGAMISSIIIRKLSSLPSQQLKAIQVHR